jgi:signal transduction histidine kinase
MRSASPGKTSIRTRVLAIVLIPSVMLLIVGVGFSSYLVWTGVEARNWAANLLLAIDPGIGFVRTLENERRDSQLALAGDPAAVARVETNRKKTDDALAAVGPMGPALEKLNPDAVGTANAAFVALLAQLPGIRQQVDLRTATMAGVDDFYSRFTGVVVTGLDGTVATAPDARAAADGTAAADVFQVADAMARGNALAAGVLYRGKLSGDQLLQYAQLVGSYHVQLTALHNRVAPAVRARIDALVQSPAWQTLTAVESALITTGSLPVGQQDWQAAADQVASSLLDLWGAQFHEAQATAASTAESALTRFLIGGFILLVVTVAAFAAAVRLANALVRRLRDLRAKTLELADHRLPDIVGRLHAGQAVDIDAEIDALDHGRDEIGEVAGAFNKAQRVAFEAAASEAKTRDGVNAVFLDIAHRSQLVVRRQLQVLDQAEAGQQDPEQLELLFQLDHLATRARRNAENLVILGGGQPGRRWRNPVPLREIVRSAVSETEDFARVDSNRLPRQSVVAAAVADLTHLIAELVDNATTFSPPDSHVTVLGNVVGKGVVIEIQDQGLGIPAEDRALYNENLRNPPDFEFMALTRRRTLGLFVVGQLSRRQGISVTLTESAYGGVTAIVLIPSTLVAGEEEPGSAAVAVPASRRPSERPRRREARPGGHDASAEPVLQASGGAPQQPDWPREEPARPVPAAPREPPANRTNSKPSGAGSMPRPQRSAGKRQLPRRERQANLAPQLAAELANEAATGNKSEQPAPRRGARSPEQAQALMSAMRHGTRQGRDAGSGTSR